MAAARQIFRHKEEFLILQEKKGQTAVAEPGNVLRHTSFALLLYQFGSL